MKRVLAIGFLFGIFSTVSTGAAEGWEILFAPRVTRGDTGLSYHYRVRSLGSNRGDVDMIRIRNLGRMSNLLTPEIWESPGRYVTSLITFGIDTSLKQPPVVWHPYRLVPFPFTLNLVERELQQGRRSQLPEDVKEALRLAEESPQYPPRLFNAVSPGGTSPEFGILDSADLPGIIAWDVLSTFPSDSEVKDADHTVGPEFFPDDLSLPQRLFRIENLIREARGLGWLGAMAAERLQARSASIRRKLSMPGEASNHSSAAWAKTLQMRDELKDSFEAWTTRRPYDPTGFPDYNLVPAGIDQADDRAWYLLEPNLRDILDRLAPPPPPPGQGRGPTRR